MATASFEETWYPLIGKHAAEELRRFRKTTRFTMWSAVPAGGAGALIGASTIGDIVGGALAITAALGVWLFLWGQWKIGAALSEWCAIEPKIHFIPKMNPRRVDQWRKANGYMTPDERQAAANDRTARIRLVLKQAIRAV